MILREMFVLSAWLGSSVLSAAADNPTISNRPPKPGEVGYRPGDGETVRLNPPSFIWLHEKDAATYAIQWATQPDFADAETARGFVWNTYTHHTPLAPGEYHWRYRFTAQDGRQSGWSAVRKVVVPADAKPFPMPTRAQQQPAVPAGHPRLFLRPEDLPRLRGLAAGKLAGEFAQASRRGRPDHPCRPDAGARAPRLGSRQGGSGSDQVLVAQSRADRKSLQGSRDAGLRVPDHAGPEVRRGRPAMGVAPGLLGSRRPDQFPAELRSRQAHAVPPCAGLRLGPRHVHAGRPREDLGQHAAARQRRVGKRRDRPRHGPLELALQQPRQSHLAQGRRSRDRLPGRDPGRRRRGWTTP